MGERALTMDDRVSVCTRLVNNPCESEHVELKPWLNTEDKCDAANLAQAMLAMANSGGGYILIGLSEADGIGVPAQARPDDFAMYHHDKINGIVQSYAEPAFHCDVYLVTTESGDKHPVICVPGEHRVPIRAKRSGPNEQHVKKDTYYVRRPGPCSEAPQTGREWDELIGRCIRYAKSDLLDGIRQIFYGTEPLRTQPVEDPYSSLRQWDAQCTAAWRSKVSDELGNEEPSRFAHGTWSASYQVVGQLPEITNAYLYEVLDSIRSGNQGIAPWAVYTGHSAPYVVDNVLECCDFHSGYTDGYHSLFWRAASNGFLFQMKGHREDAPIGRWTPGHVIDLCLPIWRVAEVLNHARALVESLQLPEALLRFKFSWSGLANRELASRNRDVEPGRIARQDSVSSELEAEYQTIEQTFRNWSIVLRNRCMSCLVCVR